jgi:hypothetical protein
MSNGTVCCILAVCCPDVGKRKAKLAGQIASVMESSISAEKEDYTFQDYATSTANWLLDSYDLVPKGLGAAIVEAYRPEFTKLSKAEGGSTHRPTHRIDGEVDEQ